MKKIELEKDIPLLDIGNKYQIAGLVFSGQEDSFILTLPHKHNDIYEPFSHMQLSMSDLEKFIRQLDIVEVEMFSQHPLMKQVVRKTQRQIDSVIQWQVFKRDDYRCRYCGRDGIPLSVDHIILWENGGPTIVDNLFTACKTCNRKRHNTGYVDWLQSSLYVAVSKNLPNDTKRKNQLVTFDLPRLEGLKVQHVRSR